ncbi:secreted protein [gut metagenome]|uniref:Secreted protein n=1 Tax=gut metagenome TaxID=749906 RepID=J9FH93_9ZZZZ
MRSSSSRCSRRRSRSPVACVSTVCLRSPGNSPSWAMWSMWAMW